MKSTMLIALLAAVPLQASATPKPAPKGDTVVLKVGDPLARAAWLKPGTHRYLRYVVKDGHRVPLDIWVRKVTFETRDGKQLVRVWQQWDAAGAELSTRIEDSVMEAGTMRPVTHYRSRLQKGETTVAAFRFDGAKVSGDAAVADNSMKDFAKEGAAPLYNFVPDIEWFQQLPMAHGRTFVASLYDPPSGEPQEYRFTVAGSERIAGPDGKPVDCWLVTTDYNQPQRPLTRSWFAKSNQQLIRQEADAGPRGRLIKILLPSEMGDEGK